MRLPLCCACLCGARSQNRIEPINYFPKIGVEPVARVRQDDRQAVITVSDDGPGIPAADRERIWERFARLDDDRSRTSGGSGLGLAMVRELTMAHGGTVSVTSRQPGPGATFLVCLPVTADRTR